ncbi:PQQ-binding-like beta-propeller repeat protein [Streptomyces sp. NPDC056503]|uniref:outer membrane protein assembly factor BamB family protein n=1 Tax=Streptomyces sp. NPDC056503 TaxID=3345842 RepID=UPI0036A2D8E5
MTGTKAGRAAGETSTRGSGGSGKTSGSGKASAPGSGKAPAKKASGKAPASAPARKASGKAPASGSRDSAREPASRFVRYTVVGGLVLALLAGCGAITAGVLAGEGHLPGDSMREVWSAGREDARSESGNGAWAVGDTLVSSRSHGVTGFDARTGARRWSYTPSGSAAICSVSRAAEDGVALVAQGTPGTPDDESVAAGLGCATVVALDLRDGRELWRAARTPDGGEIRDEKDVVAVGGGLAVVRDEDAYWPYAWSGDGAGERAGYVRPDRALRALDLRTGKPRWTAAMPKGCVPYGVAAARRQVLALVVCERKDIRLAAFDPADGRHRWTTELSRDRVVEPIANESAFLSADPAVVSVDGLDLRGYPTVLSFSADGRAQGRIASGGDIDYLATDAPAQALVAYGRLYAVEAMFHDTISAFDLRTGQRLWRAKLERREDVLALRVAGGRVTALVDLYASKGEDGLLVLDADTGEERDLRTFPDSVGASFGEITDLFGHDGRLIPARGAGFRPFSAYEER